MSALLMLELTHHQPHSVAELHEDLINEVSVVSAAMFLSRNDFVNENWVEIALT